MLKAEQLHYGLKQEVDPCRSGAWARWRPTLMRRCRLMEGEGTRRLALLDMDWEHVRAVDLLMVLRSFLAEVHPFLPGSPQLPIASADN